jgi:dGTPase
MVDKTQVFSSGASDHFRNRLTHTLEVAQISRSVAEALGLNDDLAETLALVHDIGHPPFAHAGEQELDRRMRRFGEGFDHNHQGLRIVEKFESRYARFPGLNLTFEVREGIVKHSRDFAPGEIPAFDEYLPGLKPPLEAQLIDLCDEIAYNTADLDDAYSAGLAHVDSLCESIAVFGGLWVSVTNQFPDAAERNRMHEVVRQLIHHLVTGLIAGTSEACSEVESPEEVRSTESRLCRYNEASRETEMALKQYLRKQVYDSPDLLADRQAAMSRIGSLFEHFLKHPEDMPSTYLESVSGESLHRVVCDYLAGMTDGFLNRTWSQFVGGGC